MRISDMRAGITQAQFNEQYSTIFFAQILIVSVGLGLLTWSWWVFGIVLFGLLISLFFKKIAVVICVTFSLCWGAIGLAIGLLIGNVGAAVVLCILGFFIGLGVNLSGLQWAQDLTATDGGGDDIAELEMMSKQMEAEARQIEKETGRMLAEMAEDLEEDEE